jgi:hypothetical protein
MRKQVSFNPPGRAAQPARPAPVRRRHVLYVPGYDHEAKTRSRALFVRELIRYGRRFGLTERSISPAEDIPDVPRLRWRVRIAKDDWATDTTYEVLRWDDLVVSDFRRPTAVCLAWLAVSTVDTLVTGLTPRLFRLNPIFAAVGSYPFVMVLLLALASAGLGFATHRLIVAGTGAHWLLGTAAGFAVAAAVARLARPHYGRWYVWHLMHDWLFNWEHGNGRRADYDARVDRFAEHLRHVVRTSEADEIVVVGHSSGAGMAAETVARALERDPALGRSGPDLALLTIGTSLPASAMGSRARAIHADLVRIMREPDVLWVDYQAPQDWLNAAGFNPLRMLPLNLAETECRNPVIRSPRFREITSDQTYRTMIRSPFRMHFQFMMANDRPGEYDFVMMALGPMRLSERIRDPEAAVRLVTPVAPSGPAAPTG